MTSAFAQYKSVQKPSKQHRFDCLESKLHSSVVTRLNCTVTWENYLDTLEVFQMKMINVHNNRAEWQQSSWQSQQYENVSFYVHIEQCTNI